MKGKLRVVVLSLIMLISFAMILTSVSAQTTEEPSTSSGALGIICMIYLCILLVPFIIIIVATVMVYNDADSLGIENAWVWGLVVS